MKGIEIPFGAKDSELCGWEYTIPEGMEAVVKDGKVIVRRKESEDERIRKWLIREIKATHDYDSPTSAKCVDDAIAWLERQKENPKCADSVSLDCESNAKCEDRWHKVEDSLPDNGREVLAKDKLGNTLLARYDSEGWDVSVYDNEDYRCHIGISKWCDIPSEKWKEQKPAEWSEEDEKTLKELICYIENWKQRTKDKSYNHTLWSSDINECDRFLSLLNSIHLQPRWSEENDTAIHLACEFIRHHSRRNDTIGGIDCDELVRMLKSLRPSKDCLSCAQNLKGYISGRSDAENKLLEQFGALVTPEDELHIKPRWKPNKYTLSLVKKVADGEMLTGVEQMAMGTLYEQLKKL